MTNRVAVVLLYGGAVLTALVAGTIAGRWLGLCSAEGTRSESSDNELHLLTENLVGIRVGQHFPDVLLWDELTGPPLTISDVLPNGGVLVVAALGCEPCVAKLAALQEAVNRHAREIRPVVIVADRAHNVDSLISNLRGSGIGIPVYVDVEESLRRRHNVATSMALFVLDSKWTVEDIKVGGKFPDDYLSLVER